MKFKSSWKYSILHLFSLPFLFSENPGLWPLRAPLCQSRPQTPILQRPGQGLTTCLQLLAQVRILVQFGNYRFQMWQSQHCWGFKIRMFAMLGLEQYHANGPWFWSAMEVWYFWGTHFLPWCDIRVVDCSSSIVLGYDIPYLIYIYNEIRHNYI